MPVPLRVDVQPAWSSPIRSSLRQRPSSSGPTSLVNFLEPASFKFAGQGYERGAAACYDGSCVFGTGGKIRQRGNWCPWLITDRAAAGYLEGRAWLAFGGCVDRILLLARPTVMWCTATAGIGPAIQVADLPAWPAVVARQRPCGWRMRPCAEGAAARNSPRACG